MPKKAKELSATEVKRLTHAISANGEPYNALHPVGGVAGLLLQVTPSCAKSWIYRATFGVMLDEKGATKRDKNGVPVPKRLNIGLGGFPDVTLAQAREKARENKTLIKQGINPVEQKKAMKRAIVTAQLSTITFNKAAHDYIAMKEKEFKNPRQSAQWTSTLNDYVMPHIGHVPVRELNLAHIKTVLDPIWHVITPTANNIRGRIENILGWYAIHGCRSEENPARWKGYLDKVYPAPSKTHTKGHHAALPVDALPAFMQDLKQRHGTAARALEFLILTASRTNEVIGDKRIGKAGITWQELDFTKKVWTVPANRMMSGKIHRVPLTAAAVEMLQAIGVGKPDELVFSNPKGGIPSNNFLTSVLKRMDVAVTAHGFRSTFKDWAREHTSYADEESELALAYVNDDATRAAYARSELIEKRRLLMQDWEQFCYHAQQDKSGKVVAIGGGRL
jgi:integrase